MHDEDGRVSRAELPLKPYVFDTSMPSIQSIEILASGENILKNA